MERQIPTLHKPNDVFSDDVNINYLLKCKFPSNLSFSILSPIDAVYETFFHNIYPSPPTVTTVTNFIKNLKNKTSLDFDDLFKQFT